MKIPQIIATQDVPVPQRGYASMEMAGAPGQALAQGAYRAERSLAQLAATIQDVERAKRDQGVKIETSALQSQMDLEAATAVRGLRLVETDPDAYTKRAAEAVKQSYENAVKQAKYPETKALLGLHYDGLRKSKGIEAMEYSNELYVSRNEGLLDTNLATTRISGSVAPENPGPGVTSSVDYYNKGRQAIVDATPLLGQKKAADKLIQWDSDFSDSRARAELRTDPNADVTRFQPFMKPEKYDALLTHQGVLQRAAIAEADKRERKMQHDLDEDRKYITDEYDSRSMRGDLSMEELERAREARMVVGDDYRRIAKQVAEGKDVPDMPDVADRLIMGSHGSNPTVTEREVQMARAAGQLSLKTAQSILDRLRTTTNTNRDQADSQLKRDHEQAEQIARAALNIRPGLVAEALKDDPAGRLYFAMLDELSRRSALYQGAYGGTENPLKAMDEMAPRYNRALVQSNNNKVQEIQLSLRYPTRQALEQAKTAGQINQSAYMLELRKFSEIDRLPKVTPPAATISGSPSGGRLQYTPEKK